MSFFGLKYKAGARIATARGLNNRCHPDIFVDYKDENDMTKAESDYHKEVAQKFWD